MVRIGSMLQINRIRSILQNQSIDIISTSQMTQRNDYIQRINVNVKRKRRKAAVLVLICQHKGTPSILFTKRSKNVSTHKSQISFPGGHIHQNENGIETETEERAAIREFQEECPGVVSIISRHQKEDQEFNIMEAIDVLGKTQPIPALTGTLVTPVIAIIKHDLCDLNEAIETDRKVENYHSHKNDEVDQIFFRSIEELIQSEKMQTIKWSRTNDFTHSEDTKAPVYPGNEGQIWGLTAFILRPILNLLSTTKL